MTKPVDDPTLNLDHPDFEELWHAINRASNAVGRFNALHPRTTLDHGTNGIIAGLLIESGFGRLRRSAGSES